MLSPTNCTSIGQESIQVLMNLNNHQNFNYIFSKIKLTNVLDNKMYLLTTIGFLVYIERNEFVGL